MLCGCFWTWGANVWPQHFHAITAESAPTWSGALGISLVDWLRSWNTHLSTTAGHGQTHLSVTACWVFPIFLFSPFPFRVVIIFLFVLTSSLFKFISPYVRTYVFLFISPSLTLDTTCSLHGCLLQLIQCGCLITHPSIHACSLCVCACSSWRFLIIFTILMYALSSLCMLWCCLLGLSDFLIFS